MAAVDYCQVALLLRGKLDREQETQCRLRLRAYDGGNPPRTGAIEIIVNVLDSNDNKPEFTSEQYQVNYLIILSDYRFHYFFLFHVFHSIPAFPVNNVRLTLALSDMLLINRPDAARNSVELIH